MFALDYLDVLSRKLAEIKATEQPALARAADALAEVIVGGGLIYVFGCGHSAALTMDLFYRAGGLLLVHPVFDERILLDYRPVTDTSAWEQREGWAQAVFTASGATAGDAIIIFSNSGRNGAPIDVALAAREAGVRVIAITSLAYQVLPARHSSGKRLAEVADIVIDSHVDVGDAALSLPGLEQPVGPTSTVLGSAVAQAMVVEAIARLVARGETHPVWVSGNVPGGKEHNERLLQRYRDRIRFM